METEIVSSPHALSKLVNKYTSNLQSHYVYLTGNTFGV